MTRDPHRGSRATDASTDDLLVSTAEPGVDASRLALRARSAQDLVLATELAHRVHTMDAHDERLTADPLRLTGDDAARIAEHAAMVGARPRYLLAGDPNHLTAEVR